FFFGEGARAQPAHWRQARTQRTRPRCRARRASQPWQETAMDLRSWARRLFAPASRAARRAARPRPRLQALQDRPTPATLTVTNPLDDGSQGSLRWAITQANSNPGADTIDTYETPPALSTIPRHLDLTLGGTQLPTITGDLTVLGHRDTVISGAGRGRIFEIASGVTVNLDGVTLTGGRSDGMGGAVLNSGTLSVSNSVITANQAADGGGIFNGGALTLTDSTISDNRATRS